MVAVAKYQGLHSFLGSIKVMLRIAVRCYGLGFRVKDLDRACTHFLGPSKSASGCTLAHWKQNLNHWLPGYCIASACGTQGQ
jgi:hypothetical protein